uniref:Calcineurin-like phosphoesterase domain-containing protein n=1 Tax=Picea sitchensis TaxID=3332 RepID=D5A8B8_PICSI|nr:unknown [Picea sitchensis]
MEKQVHDYECSRLPALLSRFVDTFVDFVVGGQFLSSNSTPTDERDSNWAHRVTRIPSTDRLVAIGDIHGDLQKARQALMAAQVMDENNQWIGGKTTVVQVGDLLDRGGEEIKVIYLLEKLKQQAEKSGGRVVILNGNHEIMNVEGDFRFVTPAAMDEFKGWAHWYTVGNDMKNLCEGLGHQRDIFEGIPAVLPEAWRARIAALRPGGPISSRFLSTHPTVVIVGGSVFVHGGLLPTHVYHGLERINEEVKDWILGGKGNRGPPYLHGSDAVVWLRKFSRDDSHCSLLEKALSSIPGAKRMVVGHTIQTLGINGACENRVIRVDVGMSKGCINGIPEVLEIKGDSELRVLTPDPAYRTKQAEKVQQEKPGLGLLLSENGTREVEVRA